MQNSIGLPVIEGTVSDMYNLFRWQLEDLCNVLGNIKDSSLLLCSNIIHLPNYAFVQYACKGLCDILHVQVAPCSNTYEASTVLITLRCNSA